MTEVMIKETRKKDFVLLQCHLMEKREQGVTTSEAGGFRRKKLSKVLF
jgi:hypothetical protein